MTLKPISRTIFRTLHWLDNFAVRHSVSLAFWSYVAWAIAVLVILLFSAYLMAVSLFTIELNERVSQRTESYKMMALMADAKWIVTEAENRHILDVLAGDRFKITAGFENTYGVPAERATCKWESMTQYSNIVKGL